MLSRHGRSGYKGAARLLQQRIRGFAQQPGGPGIDGEDAIEFRRRQLGQGRRLDDACVACDAVEAAELAAS